MVYRNVKTGAEIITGSVIISPNYVLVEPSQPFAPKKTETPKAEPPKTEPEVKKDPVQETKPAKKPANKSASKKRTRK